MYGFYLATLVVTLLCGCESVVAVDCRSCLYMTFILTPAVCISAVYWSMSTVLRRLVLSFYSICYRSFICHLSSLSAILRTAFSRLSCAFDYAVLFVSLYFNVGRLREGPWRKVLQCHGRFVGPMFSIVAHPVFYHFTTLLAFVTPTSPRLNQLRSRAPRCLGPPKDCKLRSRSRDVILRESSELKKEIRKYVSLASIELKLSWP